MNLTKRDKNQINEHVYRIMRLLQIAVIRRDDLRKEFYLGEVRGYLSSLLSLDYITHDQYHDACDFAYDIAGNLRKDVPKCIIVW